MKRLSLLIGCLFAILPAFAGHENDNNFISAGTVAPLANYWTTNSQYGSYPGPPFTDVSIENRVTVMIDHSSSVYQGTKLDYTFNIELYMWDASTTFSMNTIQLRVEYDPAALTTFRDKHVFTFDGKLRIFTRIVSIIDNSTGSGVSNPADIFMLRTDIDVERYYPLAYTAPISPVQLNSVKPITDEGEFDITWPVTYGAEEYDLEWTWVNTYTATSGSFTHTGKDYDFRNNSTRVRLTGNSYKVSNVFDKGVLVYRVRPIGRNPGNLTKLLFGAWSLADNGTLSSFIPGSPGPYGAHYAFTAGHEYTMNWQYSGTFSEDGKKKEIVSYFDGSLRNRQMVTRSNSNYDVLVVESFYDHQGRKAIGSLPTPVDRDSAKANGGNAIRYYENFNQNTDGVKYSRMDFDIDSISDCYATTRPFDDVSGAGRYYSPSNPEQSTYNGYLPQSYGYPFTRSEYTPDNTGRIRRQGDVGPDFQLIPGRHYTSYYYGKPLQFELDRLFGSEAGYARFYKKEMTIDPNGQVTVNFKDLTGKVVVTALSGGNPGMVEELPSHDPAYKSITADLFEKDAVGNSQMNRPNINGNGLSFNTTLLVAENATYSFDYSITAPAYVDGCMNPGICFDCVYDLTIRIVDECGVVIDSRTKSVGLDELDLTCAMPQISYSSNDPTPLTLNLNVGNYHIFKELTVNEEAFDYYMDALMDSTKGCFKTEAMFIAEEMANVDSSGCEITCEECVESLGTRDEFVLNGFGSEEDWQLAYDNCMEPCRETSKCQTLYRHMLSDMSPGGQYGEWYDTSTGRMNSGAFPLSILNMNNHLPHTNFGSGAVAPNWRTPKHPNHGDGYYYPNGTRAAILLSKQEDGSYLPQAFITFTGSDGLEYAFPEHLSHNKDFVFYWHSHWAYSLVQYHPEYCYYDWCEVNDEKTYNETSSEEFDNLLTATETFADAVTLNLVSTTSYAHTQLLDQDPYFASGGRGSGQYAAMNSILGSPSYQGTGYTIYEMAAFATRCPGYYGTSAPPTSWNCFDFGQGSDPVVLDQEWGMLQGIYQTEKYKLQQAAARHHVLNSVTCTKGLNGCIGEKNYVPSMDGLTGWGMPDISKTASVDRYFLYATKTRRFLLERDLTVSANNTDFNLFYSSGLCPEAFHLEGFLRRIAADGDLLNTFDLRNKSYFTQQMYEKVNLTIDPNHNDYDYTPSITALTDVDVLTIQFDDPINGPSACEIKLALPTAYTWSMVTGLKDIRPFPNGSAPNQFQMTALLDDDADPITPDIEVTIVGNSCFATSGCTFEYECEASQYAIDLMNLMNTLIQTGSNELLSTSDIDLESPPYDDFLTTNIKYFMSPISSDRVWVFDNLVKKFYLKSSDVMQTDEIEFDIIGYDPGTYTDADLNKIEFFSNIKPDPSNVNRFLMVAYMDDDADPNTAAVPVTVLVQATYTNPPIADQQFGYCHLPVPSFCKSPEHFTRLDLEPFLNEIVTNPPTSTVELNDLPLWTTYMQGQLGTGSYRLGAPEVYFDSMVFDIISNEFDGYDKSICRLKIFRIDPYFFDRYDFDDIVELKDIRVNMDMLIDGKAYAFTLTAVHSNGVEEIIGGSTSCLPVKDCGCDPVPLEGGEGNPPGGSSGNGDCDAMYAAYLDAIHLFNNNAYGNNPGMTIQIIPVSRENFDCKCLTTYVKYLENWDGISPLMSYQDACESLTGCSDKFQDYVDAVNDWNAGHPGDEIDVQAVNGELCACFDKYIKYLQNFTGPGNPLTIIDFSGGGFCDDIYSEESSCIEKIENLRRAHMEFAACTTRNPNGYQFYGLSGPDLDPDNCYCLDAYAAYLDNLNQGVGDPPPMTLTDFITGGHCPGSLLMMAPKDGPSNKDLGGMHQNKDIKENTFGDELLSGPSPEDVIIENSSLYTPIYGGGWSCGKTIQFVSDRYGYYSRCGEHLLEVAINNGKIRYERYLDSLQGAFRYNYNQYCLSSLEETFTTSFTERTYQYTLYYYDQAGNLVRTVPPAGVFELTTQDQFDSVNYDRTHNKRKFFTQHVLVTKYEYNSQNLLIKQSSPDYEKMDRWYINGSPVGGVLPANFVATASYAVDGSTTILAGTLSGKGVIYRSDDAGKNWYAFGNILASDLKSISMGTGSVGFAVGNDGLLYHTSDGGDSWDIHPHTLGTGDHLNTVYFKDASNGVVVGQNGACYVTSNGGSSWTASTTSFTGDLTGLTAQSSTVLFLTENVSGAGIVYKSTDFGANWTASVNYSANSIKDIHMLSSSEGYAAGESGTLLYTSDGGTNWFLVPTGTALDFRAIYFRDTDKGMAILEASGDDGGHIYKTADGGITWTQASAIGEYRSFSFYTTDEGYAVGKKGTDGILAQVNALTGKVAKKANHASMAGIDLYAVHFNTVDEGYVAGDGGKLLVSTNASSALSVWTDINTSLPSEDFRDIYFRTTSEGVILAESGLLVKYSSSVFSTPFNGGTEHYTDLKAVSGWMFASDKDGYGKLWRTPTNSGAISLSGYQTYSSTENPNSEELNTVGVIASTTALAAGENGVLFKNLSVQTKNVTALGLHAVSAVSGGTEVFAVGEQGDFWYSTNSGTDWQLQSTGTVNTLYAVDFTDANNGLLGGVSGTLLRYTSGSLASISIGSTSTIYDIDYASSSLVALCGSSGLLKKSPDGGVNWSNAGTSNLSSAYTHYALAYIGAGDIVVAGQSGLVWKSDGSVLTRTLDLSLPEITDIHFANANLGLMSGYEGALLRSENGGGSWTLVPAPNKNQDRLNSAWRTGAIEWFVADENGDVLRTINSGNSWNTQYTAAQQLNDLAFDGENAGVAVGDNGIVVYSANAGVTWSTATLGTPTSVKLRSVQMINQRGYLAGDNGTFMSSDDWGQNWTTYATGTSENLHQVYFHDYYTGYVVGENGTLSKSVEGGDTWVAKTNNINGTSNTTQDLYTMAFNSRFNGVFAGDDYERRLTDEADLYSGFFYYDYLARLVISENTKQFNKSNHSYSYTLFDYKSRIVEAGELNQIADARTLIKDRQISNGALITWINGATSRIEVTTTQYEEPHGSVSVPGFTQDNLRKRVASIFYEETDDANSSTYTSAVHYSYDIHGNVTAMIQDYPVLNTFGRRYLRLDYEYDLVSGKTNAVHFQDGERDQWHHRYTYDADNRITEVQTSLDGIIWDVDARYEYYRHGPLARMETGDIQVQGTDYAYTLEGRIKGVNSMTLVPNEDMGTDGFTAPGFARDAFGYILGYWQSDYHPINLFAPGPGHFIPNTLGSDLMANRSDFYNRNISMMITSIKDPASHTALPQGYAYQYDQMNRLMQMRAFSNYNLINNEFQFSGSTPQAYGENFTYDANGNILTLDRSGIASNLNMDGLSYRYDYYNNNPAEGLRSNRLYHLNDGVGSSGYDDIQNQGTFVPASPINDVNALNNYGYDEMGNLIRDNQEEIASITWTVTGKIKSITRTIGSTQPNLEFVYDPMGNRIAKIETPNPYSSTGVKTTIYARDGVGNHLATYDHHWNPNTSNEYFLLDERILYGTRRLGMQGFNDSIYGPEDIPPVIDYYERNLARKRYEGINHLNNVLVAYSDKKLPVDANTDGTIDYFEADICASYDYYSYGAPMPDRTLLTQACSTQTTNVILITYMDDFLPGFMWMPMGGAAIMPVPGSMMVTANAPGDGCWQNLPCQPGVMNTLDITVTLGNNPLQINLLDPMTMMPLPGFPQLIPGMAGGVMTMQYMFIGPPPGNVLVQITVLPGPFPFPDIFTVDFVMVSHVQTISNLVCWNEDYRFGYNGMEKDNDAKGQGNSLDFKNRIYDPRTGRFYSVDPISNQLAMVSPYQFASLSPIQFIDIDGLEGGEPKPPEHSFGVAIPLSHPTLKETIRHTTYTWTYNWIPPGNADLGGKDFQVFKNTASMSYTPSTNIVKINTETSTSASFMNMSNPDIKNPSANFKFGVTTKIDHTGLFSFKPPSTVPTLPGTLAPATPAPPMFSVPDFKGTLTLSPASFKTSIKPPNSLLTPPAPTFKLTVPGLFPFPPVNPLNLQIQKTMEKFDQNLKDSLSDCDDECMVPATPPVPECTPDEAPCIDDGGDDCNE